ncbi:acetyl-CoA C-acyltransferase [Microbulbifer thermotolerans]|uniref:Acetyl-CoA acetyltransferase n=1 Tax=Microbulbifer thermotolerans TaxID=252514 RepID=A0A143HRC3_MICTH|nr:acetyl-CoA C-acyltransferase [Microbulbifer thermotolerans]AMX04066.1 acetyl-CoA acetyltransferase [Microbulbifer thermotolerans]MCX2830080.1 acetyl-CoA C-acyltransferase [Microbulbifer thermotolerans]WKT61600.1 acetyl-CoA C-acyltransferase [Microbulbifer thermotolerans]
MSDVTSDPVVIVGMARTPMGAMQGGLSEVSAPELGSVAIRAALEDAGVAPADVDEVLMGCVLPAGVGQAPARQASIRAGVPEGTPCTTVNKVCGSGMKTVMMARDALLLGEGRVIVAGGMESMTNAPYLLPKARGGMRLGHGEVKDHMFLDGLENAYDGKLMGNFAENTADKYGFTREEQDAFALESLARAQKAIESGVFEREIAPVTISTRRGDVQVRVDEGPGNARPDKIPQLKPAFRKDGTVTAANASSISDGAAALVLMRRSEAERRGLKVLAVLRGQAQFAHQPEWFTTAPVGAMQKLLERTGWSVDEVDLFEINEAFAVVAMAAMRELNLPHDKVNVNGGACALGHPLGASGARILVTLLAAMEKRDVKRGIASLCIGGGEATAVAIERA